MAVAVLSGAAAGPVAGGIAQLAGDVVRHGAGADSGCDGAGERAAQTVSQVLLVPGALAFRQLFHDHHLPDAGALPGLDVATVRGSGAVCGAGLVDFAFWADAVASGEVDNPVISKQ